MRRFLSISSIALAFSLISFGLVDNIAQASEGNASLPTSDRAPLPVDHFPNNLHAFVFRNWGLVTAERLAKVVDATPEQVTAIAVSMGLPSDPVVPEEMLTRGYITLVRRNWHLLPYDQLLSLLDLTADQFALRLQEDDFLWVKLGLVKPNAEAIAYSAPTEQDRKRADEIRQSVERNFGALGDLELEGRFEFIHNLSALPTATTDRLKEKASPVEQPKKPRYVYSYFAMFGDPLIDPSLDPFPDGLLARLQERGVNGVWLHVVLRDLSPPTVDFPNFGAGHEKRLENLRKLVDRAKAFGIDIYLYINEPRSMPESFFANQAGLKRVSDPDTPSPHFSLCTSVPMVRDWVSDSLAHVFNEVPNLGGVFTITASENLTNCSSKFNRHECPRCKDRTDSDILVEINKAIAEGVHRSAPDAKVIAWDWGWAGHGDASETVAKLPKDIWFMSVSEWSLPIERGGVTAVVGEYSITGVGPGPRATKHWKVAQEHGLKTAAKMQLNVTWEIAAVPYIPATRLIAQHFANLAPLNLDGQMMSWSLGGYPSPNLQLAELFNNDPSLSVEEAMRRLAVQDYGADASAEVLAAWNAFSDGYLEYPYAGMYTGPQHIGPSNLLYARPTGYNAGMVCFPYDNLAAWCGPFPAAVYAQQFEKVADGFDEGLVHLRKAASVADKDAAMSAKHASIKQDVGVAEAAGLHLRTVAQQVRFIAARDELLATDDSERQAELKKTLRALLEKEIEAAKKLYPIVLRDSRIGYEASNHYFYVPQDLIEKVISCEQLIESYQSEP